MPEESINARRATRESFPSDSLSDCASACAPDSAAHSAVDIPALEARLLQLLCQIPAGIEREEIFEQFLSGARSYHWRIPEHQVIFQALARVPQLSGAALRAMLPAQLTRAGFPDIEIAHYFAPLDVPQGEQAARACKTAAEITEVVRSKTKPDTSGCSG